MDTPNLPTIANARLPETYERAKAALIQCQRIDECRKWTNKAHALAAYARMAKDDALFKMAVRIQARAIGRAETLASGDNQTRITGKVESLA